MPRAPKMGAKLGKISERPKKKVENQVGFLSIGLQSAVNHWIGQRLHPYCRP